MSKIHLPLGSRSACRYTSRPSRRVRLARSIQAFSDTPILLRCKECSDYYQSKCDALAQQASEAPEPDEWQARRMGEPEEGWSDWHRVEKSDVPILRRRPDFELRPLYAALPTPAQPEPPASVFKRIAAQMGWTPPGSQPEPTDERAAFEEAMSEAYDDFSTESDGCGGYHHAMSDCAWVAWQERAARALKAGQP